MEKDMNKTPALSVILGIGKAHKSEAKPMEGEEATEETDKSELEMAAEAILSAIAKKSAKSLIVALQSFMDCAEMDSDEEENKEEE